MLEVEEIALMESKIKQKFIHRQDRNLTTGYIKAARLILNFLKRFRERIHKRSQLMLMVNKSRLTN